MDGNVFRTPDWRKAKDGRTESYRKGIENAGRGLSAMSTRTPASACTVTPTGEWRANCGHTKSPALMVTVGEVSLVPAENTTAVHGTCFVTSPIATTIFPVPSGSAMSISDTVRVMLFGRLSSLAAAAGLWETRRARTGRSGLSA